MTGRLRVLGVDKRFGAVAACAAVWLEVAAGEFVSLLGDSGCGKTTLLRIIAGFTAPDAGRVLRDGADIGHLPPGARRMGFVFQSYALFPTKTVEENIRFALDVAGTRAEVGNRRVRELAETLEIGGLLARFPHELSGGQQQRVALARALAPAPDIILLDEPLSALDARIRVRLREELRSIVDRFGVTAVYVTHDQEEALALSDRVAVMRAGRIEQIGTPAEIYARPASLFVASFVGRQNRIAGIAAAGGLRVASRLWPMRVPPGIEPGARVIGLIRPEDLAVTDAADATGFPARVTGQTYLGATVRLHLAAEDGQALIADCPSRAPVPAIGARPCWRYNPDHACLFREEPA